MKKQHKLIILASICLLLIAGSGVYYVQRHQATKNSDSPSTRLKDVDYSAGTTDDNKVNDDRKSNPPLTTDSGTTSGSGSTTAAPSITVTRAGVVDNNLEVSVLLQNAASGTCTLTVTQDGQPAVTATNTITTQNNSTVCPVFDIPLSKFSRRGQWSVAVTVTANQQSATASWLANPISLDQ